jgi:hypothetical protein
MSSPSKNDTRTEEYDELCDECLSRVDNKEISINTKGVLRLSNGKLEINQSILELVGAVQALFKRVTEIEDSFESDSENEEDNTSSSDSESEIKL